jgi:hypothetical protein
MVAGMASVRRFLVLQAFAVWQGGFVFYAGVVVPVGTAALGSAALQADVTRPVTDWLNRLGWVWALVYAWDAWADPHPPRRRVRWAGWLLAVELLVVLTLVHSRLDGLYDADGVIADKGRFRRWHVAYLWASTIQWVVALGLAWLAVRAWGYNGGSPESRRWTCPPAPPFPPTTPGT